MSQPSTAGSGTGTAFNPNMTVGGGTELTSVALSSRQLGAGAQTVSTCLAYNQAYQELLDTFIIRVESSCVQVKERQREVEKSLSMSSAESGGRKLERKVPVLTYLPPYFRDLYGMAAPLNRDAVEKVRRGEYDPLVQPSKPWSETELKTLQNAAQELAFKTHTQRLQSRYELLQEKMQAVKNDAKTPDAHKQFRIPLEALEEDIAKEKANYVAYSKDADKVDWFEVSKMHLKGQRTAEECCLKWTNEGAPDWLPLDEANVWQEAESLKLADTVAQMYAEADGANIDWDVVAQRLNNRRTPFQCFAKYQSSLNKNMYKSEWNREENDKLLETVQALQQGSFIPWEQVTYYMDGRTRAQCRAQYSRLAGIKRTGNWSHEEDMLLLVGVHKYGASDWKAVAKCVRGRTEQQCRERYVYGLEMETEPQRIKYTPQEDAQLIQKVMQYGQNWAFISSHFTHRTIGSLKTRWRHLSKLTASETAQKAILLESDDLDTTTDSQPEPSTSGGEVPPAVRNRKRTYKEPVVDSSPSNQKRSLTARHNHKMKIEQRKQELFSSLRSVAGASAVYDDDLPGGSDVQSAIAKVEDSDDGSDSLSGSELDDPSYMGEPLIPTATSQPRGQRFGNHGARRSQYRRHPVDAVHRSSGHVDRVLDKQYSKHLSKEVVDIVQRYKDEIESSARVRRSRRRRLLDESADALAHNAAQSERDALCSALAPGIAPADPPEVLDEARRELALALFEADRTLVTENTALAAPEIRRTATAKAYEHALTTEGDDEPSLSLLPPSLATFKAHKQIHHFLCTAYECNKRRRRGSKSAAAANSSSATARQPPQHLVDEVKQSALYKHLQARMEALLAWPSALTGQPTCSHTGATDKAQDESQAAEGKQ